MESISITEFNRWQQNRLQEHTNEIQDLMLRLEELTLKAQKLEMTNQRALELSTKRNRDSKKLIKRLEWALDELEEVSPEKRPEIELLRHIYGL